jgi:MATE family multidrug resistance protein
MRATEARSPADSAGRVPAPSFTVDHRIILKLAGPVTIASLSTPMVGVVDTAVIGQLGNAALIGGIAAASIVINVVFATFNFLRSATTGIVAQAYGAGEHEEVHAIALRACVLAIAFGAVLIALQFVVAKLGFDLVGIDGATRRAASGYFLIRVWSAPFVMINYAILGWLFGRGAVGWGLILQVLLNLLNILLSIWFVIYLRWNVEGAAGAALIAEGVTAVAGCILLGGALRGGIRLLATRLGDALKMRRMLSVNANILVRSLALFLAIAFFTRQGAGFGTVILAANAVLLNLFYLAGALMGGLATAAQQLAGRAVGASDAAAFRRVVRLSTSWGAVGSLAMSAVLLVFRNSIIDAMVSGADVRETARTYFLWVALTPLAAVMAFLLDGIFAGATWTKDIRNMMLISVAVFIAAWAALTPFLGNHGLWIAFLLFLIARSVTLMWQMRRLIPETFRADGRNSAVA